MTETTLSLFFARLQSFQKLCGRFPTTSEGLKALRERNIGFNCLTSWNEKTDLGGDETDGWKIPLQYLSDGTHYKLIASQGYFVTDKSPARFNAPTQHWENSNRGAWSPQAYGFPSWEYLFIVVALVAIGICSILLRLISRITPFKGPWTKHIVILKGSLGVGITSLALGVLVYCLMPSL
jgi:hypothetical protein